MNKNAEGCMKSSSSDVTGIDRIHTVDSTILLNDSSMEDARLLRSYSLGTDSIHKSVESVELYTKEPNNRGSSTSSYHEGESTAERLSGVLDNISKMSLTDLMSLCKVYRDRVLAGDNRGDVRILQEINRVLSLRINDQTNSRQPMKRNEGTISSMPDEERKISDVQDSLQNSINLSALSNESPDLSALKEDEGDLHLLKSLRKASEDSDGTLLQFSSENSPILKDIIELELIPVEEDFVVERIDGKHFESNNLHSLELKQVRIRRKSPNPEENAKRIRLSV